MFLTILSFDHQLCIEKCFYRIMLINMLSMWFQMAVFIGLVEVASVE